MNYCCFCCYYYNNNYYYIPIINIFNVALIELSMFFSHQYSVWVREICDAQKKFACGVPRAKFFCV